MSAESPQAVGPRSDLERTIDELVGHAERVLATQHRLRLLLEATREIIADLDPAAVLSSTGTQAMRLAGAGYAALRVHDISGDIGYSSVAVEQRSTAGTGPDEDALFAAFHGRAEPVRLTHPFAEGGVRSALAPLGWARAVLSVTLRVRDEVEGRLVLVGTEEFTAEDEELTAVLAASAAIALENGRLFAVSRRRERWTAAFADVSSTLLSGGADAAMPVIADHVRDLLDAVLVSVVVPGPEPETMLVAEAFGEHRDAVRGQVYPAAGTLSGQALATGSPTMTSAMPRAHQFDWQPGLGPTVAVPFDSSGHPSGVLFIARREGGRQFTSSDLELASEFAAQTSLALEVARGQDDRQQLELANDRARIARDLHDHVIQRLFAAGLTLQATAASLTDGQRSRVLDQVDAIDAAISEIRTVVFALREPRTDDGSSLRHRLLDIATELGANLPYAPRLSFTGPVDLLVHRRLADEVAAVVREGLTNVARHARASDVEVEVAIIEQLLSVRIEDDGVGFAPGGRASGTANLIARANALGGTCTIGPRASGGGTLIEWTVPLGSEEGR